MGDNLIDVKSLILKPSDNNERLIDVNSLIKKKEPTALSSSNGQSQLPLNSELEKGQGLADNSFLKQIGKDAAISHAYPSGMVDVERPIDISLKEKAPTKDYYSTRLEKGLIFDDKGKLYAPSSEALTAKIPRLKEKDINIKNIPQKDLVEQAREMPIEQPKVEEPVPEGEWGIDKILHDKGLDANLVQNVAANFELAGTKLAKGATEIVRDLSSGLSYITGQGKYPELFDKEGKPTKYAESATLLNDPAGVIALGLQANEKRMQGVINNNQLPSTFWGNAVSSAAAFAPDIVATALLPEAKIAEGASLIKRTGALLINNFTKYMTVKGGVEGYGEARGKGKDIGESAVEGLVGTARGFENGVEMAALGAGSNLATKSIMAKAEQMGLKGTAAHVTRELVNLGTDVTAFALLGPQGHAAFEGRWVTAKEIADGTGIAALFRIKGAFENIKSNAELNQAIKETQELKQGVAIGNFVDADHAAIERVYYTKESADELHLTALDFAKKARETSNLEKKAEYIAKSMTYEKAANVKQVTEDILNNPESLKKFEESGLPEDSKQEFLQKADEVRKMLDPIEQQLRTLGEDIKNTNDFIKQATEAMNAESDPVKKIKLEVRIEEANKYLEENNNKIKNLIKEQIKPNPEEDLTTNKGIKKAQKEFNKKIDEQIAALDKNNPDYKNDLEALNKKKEAHNEHYETLLNTKARATDVITHATKGTKKIIVDGVEVTQEEFDAMKNKPVGTKEIITTEVKPSAEAKVASDLVSVSVAPYYDTQIGDLSDASKLRESEGYVKHVEMLNNVAKAMGLKIESIDNTVGGFENNEGNKITEISNRVKLNTNDLDIAEKYAAIVGALAHETQEATIAARYVEHGAKNQTAIESEIKVSDLKNTVKALNEAGIYNFEINETDNSVKILDFDNGKSEEFNNKMLNFADLLDKNNVKYETEHHAIESRYVDPERRSELLKEAKLQAEQQKGGSELRDIYEKSKAKSEEFLNKKSAPAEIPEEVFNPIVNRIKKGIEKLSTTAKVSVLKGKNFAKALDEAIKNGKVNLQSWGGFEKFGFEETEKFRDLVKSGHIVQDYKISELAGKPVFVINPDNMMVGKVLSGGKLIGEGEGGVHFVSNTGDVWAFSDTDRGRINANTMVKFVNKQLKENGSANIILSRGDLGKLLSSHAGSKGAMRVLEHLVDQKMIPLADFRKALIEVGRMIDQDPKSKTYGKPKYNIDFVGTNDSKSIHNDIENKFFNKEDNTFSRRGTFVTDIINHLSANSEGAHKNIEKIREFLNTKEIPKSSEKKTGKISFSLEGLKQAIGSLFADEATLGAKNSDAYAVIKVENPEFPVERVQGGHESYGAHIRQIVNNIPLNEFLEKYKNLTKDDLIINDKNEVTGIKPKLLLLSQKSNIADIVNNTENKPTKEGNLGSNVIGLAEGIIKPESELPSTTPNLMTDANGKVYGFEQNGKIVLNADLMNGNTPFHEAGHLWINWAKENRFDLHDAGMKKIEGSKYLQDVKNNKAYQDNAAKLPEADREAYFKAEALAKAIGDNGEKFVTEAQKADFKTWVKDLWKSIAIHFGIRDMSPDDISKMTLDEFSKKVVADIVNVEPEKKAKLEIETEEKAPVDFSVEDAYKQLPKAKNLRENAQKTLINSNFDKIVEQLIKNDKIQKKC